MSSANPSTVDIKDYLEESSSPVSLTFGTNLFIGQMPAEPDNAVCIYDTGGADQGKEGLEYPSIQILVRNKSYTAGYEMARDIKYYLHNKNGLTINSTRYLLVQSRADIFSLGKDIHDRQQFTINFRIIRSGT